MDDSTPILPVKKLRPEAALPVQATKFSAGYDLCACIREPVVIPARGRAVIPTGIAVAIPVGMAGFVFGRSGLGIKHGIVPANAVGVVDADYRGELLVGLANQSHQDYTVYGGERIAQLVLMPICTPMLEEREELDSTGRGQGGFGSTGR